MADSNSPDSPALLESVIGLTRQREQRGLDDYLVDTACEITGAVRVALYIAADEGDGGPETLGLSNFAQVPGLADSIKSIPQTITLQETAESFRQSLGNKDFENETFADGSVSISYPVIGADDSFTGLLVVDYPALSIADHRLVGALLRIYQNFLALLNESQRDRLTGLLNRKTFDDRINRIVAERGMERHRTGDDAREVYSLVIMDIDHFKKINDEYGHLYGDEVLILFARIMMQSFRGEDLLFRFGGEEFIILLKTPDEESRALTLERFRHNVENFAFPQVGQVTVSGGCVSISDGSLPTTLIDRADQALYYAKANGRNQFHYYEQLVREGRLAPVKQEGSVDIF